jgi:hypothetical protein
MKIVLFLNGQNEKVLKARQGGYEFQARRENILAKMLALQRSSQYIIERNTKNLANSVKNNLVLIDW